MVLATTFLSGGSPAMAFGNLQGTAGFAQPSSIEVGARIPSLYEPYNVSALLGENVNPTEGLKRLKS